MNLAEFLESETVALPRGAFQESRQTFDTFLTDVFRDYIALVQSVNDSEFPYICSMVQNSLEEIRKLSAQIVSAVKRYLQGYPHLAYGEIEKSLESVNIDKLITKLSGFAMISPGSSFDPFLECTLHPPLYRMRSDRTSSGTFSRKDIFHVPFEDRRLVRNQRYSIAGLPCLYLGSSTWISWEELGRPDLDSVFVSRFRFAEETSVLDFQFPPLLAWRVFKYALDQTRSSNQLPSSTELRNHYGDEFVASYIVCWPLIAACSIIVDSRDGSFFPQYIVPQLLLQWVTKGQVVDGIRYFSTRTAPLDTFAHVNCVFPAREISHSGQCSYLKRKFHLTAPISWEILQSYAEPDSFVSGPANFLASVKLSDDLTVQYVRTGFYQAEAKLGAIERYANMSKPVED
jgi:hypothetical protein